MSRLGGQGTVRAAVVRRLGRIARSEWVQAVAVVSAAALVIVWQPLVSDGFFGPGDITEQSPVLRTDPEVNMENLIQGDVGFDFVPWLEWNRAELREGRLPTWNPYNGSGVPHFANGQSAVFSAFTVPFYVVGFRLALVMSAFLELVVAGLLTYGLVRQLRLSHLSGLVAALGFSLSAFMVVLLRWPMATSGAFVPGIVWAADALATATDRRGRCLAAAGLAACFGLSLLAGHPETTFFGAIMGAAVGLARLLARRQGAARLARRVAMVAGAFLLGIGLAAVQVLPLLEYISHSAADEYREGGQLFLGGDHLALHAFPLVVGGPAQEHSGVVSRLDSPWIAHSMLYMGLGLLFFGGIGAVSALWTGRRMSLVFAGGAIAWLFYGYDIAGVGALVSRLPMSDLIVALRSNVVWSLCVAVAAAFGVDAVRALDRSPRLLSTGVVAWGVGLFAAAWITQRQLRDLVSDRVDPSAAALASRTARDHLAYISATFALGLVGTVLLAGRGRHRRAAARVGAVVVVAALFLQTGWLFRDYNPTVEPDRFYARTAAFDQLTEVTGDHQTLRLDGTAMFPDVNLWYRVASPSSYDALGVRDYDALYRRLFRTPVVDYLGILHMPVDPVGIGALRVMGVRYVTTERDYPFGESAGAAVLRTVDPGGAARFELDPTGNVDVVTARSTAIERADRCRLTVRGAEATAAPLGSVEAPCGPGGAVFSLEDVDGLENLGTTTGRLDLAVVPLADGASTGGGPTGGAPPLADARLSAFTTGMGGLDLAAEVDAGYRVFQVPGSPHRYFSPAATEAGGLDDTVGDGLIADPGADPVRRSAIDGAGAGATTTGARPGEVEVVSETSTSVRLRVTRDSPGWLIAQQARYPGWRATVDGRSVETATANGAYLGVPVPAGEVEVVLRFQPTSVRVGAAVSALSLLGLVALLVVAARSRSGIPAAGPSAGGDLPTSGRNGKGHDTRDVAPAARSLVTRAARVSPPSAIDP